MNIRNLTRGLFALALLPSLAGIAAAQDDYQFVPTGADPAGNWNVPGNWTGPNGNFVPEGQFNERAFITSGGTAFIDGTIANGPGGMFIAANSRLEVRNNGLVTFVEPAANVLVDRSFSAAGELSIQGNGRMNVVDPKFEATTTLEIVYTGATTKPISGSGTGELAGTLLLDFTGVASPSGAFPVIDAADFEGSFSQVNTVGLAANQGAFVTTRAGGDNGFLLEANIANLLTLDVNRATGAVNLRNTHGSAISLDGFGIQSASGQLNAASFTGLGGGWTTSAANSNTGVGQLFEGTLGSPSASLAAGSNSSLGGSLYAPQNPTEFGVDPDDLQFTVTDAGAILDGIVNYIGDKVENTIVLSVNTTSGLSRIANTSNFPQQIEAYRVSSEAGSLVAGSWDSLDDQNVGGAFGWSEANADANDLTELIEDGTTLFDSVIQSDQSGIFSIGNVFNGGTEDLVFEFLIAGEEEFSTGVVVYDALVLGEGGTSGDFDNDGDVDGADFLFWQRNDGTPGGLAEWQAAYNGGAVQAVTAVPEPGSVTLLAIALAGVMSVCGTHRRS